MSRRSDYRNLQKHLDRQPVGFPAALTGADIRLLRHFFSPSEARVALGLSYRYGTVDDIVRRLGSGAPERHELEAMLAAMAGRGTIASRRREGTLWYALLPLVVGMYETRVKGLTKDFLKDFSAYSSSPLFGLDLAGTEPPQMRTIPVGEDVTPELSRASFEDIHSIIEDAAGPIAVLECICRKARTLKGKPCAMVSRTETCLALGDSAGLCLTSGIGREIPKKEALEILRHNVEDGLVIQPSNTRTVEFVCACCGCCCGMLRVHRFLDGSAPFLATGFYARLDTRECSACGLCINACQVGAVDLDGPGGTARVNRERCIGCGQCVRICPAEALRLNRKDDREEPPETLEDLFEMILSRKKSFRKKLALAGRILWRLPGKLRQRGKDP